MTKDPGKSHASDERKTRKARHRRQEIRRLKSGVLTLTAEILPEAGSGRQCASSDSHPSTSSAESSEREEITDVCCGEGEEPSGSNVLFGHVSMMGRRRVMEDAVTVAPPVLLAEEYTFFAVYDGHGGVKVAEKCREKMHKFLEKHVEKAKKSPEDEGFDWEKVMEECFRSMDEELEQECRLDEAKQREDRAAAAAEAAAEGMVGSTATVVLVGKEEVVVANCGDSRAVLCRGGAVVPLSRDHKPDRADEKQRIEAAGGKVINWNGWRVEGVLSTSRSLGDRSLKPYVCSEPEVSVIKRSELDEFLIIGTDGLFDVVSNEIACCAVKRCLSEQLRKGSRVSEAAAMLAELAIAKGSRDNISVIVVRMK